MSDELDQVILRDRSSGRYHRGALIGATVATPEGCNLDEAGEQDRVDHLPGDVDFGDLCKTCFKPGEPDAT